MERTDHYMWLAFVGVVCVNGLLWWRRGRREVQQHPELAEGYERLVRGFIMWGNLPWLVMGAGLTFGGVPGMDAFFVRPRNPYVLAFHLTVVGLWIALGWWVFGGGGADDLARHPGLINLRNPTPSAIKWLVAACLVGGFASMCAILAGFGPPAR